jgi:hypothetical protein
METPTGEEAASTALVVKPPLPSPTEVAPPGVFRVHIIRYPEVKTLRVHVYRNADPNSQFAVYDLDLIDGELKSY